VKIIIAPAAKPLVQVASALGLVVCLCVILAGFIIQPFWDPNRSLYRLATYEVAVLQKIVEQYRADCGEYPSTQDWPNALVRDSGVEGWNGPNLTAVPMDPGNSHSFTHTRRGRLPRRLFHTAQIKGRAASTSRPTSLAETYGAQFLRLHGKPVRDICGSAYGYSRGLVSLDQQLRWRGRIGVNRYEKRRYRTRPCLPLRILFQSTIR